MGFDLEVSVSAFTVFLQGLISFFSPCVFPLIPIYIVYLSGGTVNKNDAGEAVYDKKKVMLHTLFFVLGISFTFFVLGFGVSSIGMFFKNNKLLFARIGAVIIIIFGLYQLGLFGKSGVLGKEYRLPFKLENTAMSPATAFIMGFTFSFSWTPCVGPTLAGVLLMTASAGSKAAGFLLIGVYTLGFVIPFLLVGLFTAKLLELFKKHKNIVKYTVKIGGVLMILMGIMMFTGKMNAITGYLADISGENTAEISEETTDTEEAAEVGKTTDTEEAADDGEADDSDSKPPALDFTLTDQYGETHSLDDYKGKTIFLNFWATWCPPCRAEMPDIQKLYETYPREGDDAVIILGVAAPDYGREVSKEEVIKFLEENGYTYPVLMDVDAELFTGYGIYSYPTTFMIDRDGNVFGYVSGQLSEEMMVSIIEQTMDN